MQPWQDETIIVKWFTVAIIVVLIISISFIVLLNLNRKSFIHSKKKIKELNKHHQKKLELSSIKIQEDERQRIGSDLHDSVISSLNILYLRSQAGVDEGILIDNIQQTISLTRQISHDLNPPLLEFQTIQEVFTGVLRQWEAFYHFEIKINIHEYIDMSVEQKKHLIRIFQELMSNIHKHAECTIIEFHLRLSKKFFAIILKDNGKGFCLSKNHKGLGLKNLTTRASLLSAVFKYKTQEPNGTTFVLLIVNK
jgi:signal transduction histidine kinase